MRTPTSTYRLQITEDFDLLAAARVLPYLHDLGTDWVYLSPILASEADSDHGYDVADHSRIDPGRGGVAGLAAVSEEARRLGMGVLVDIVPNHVGVAQPAGNSWWWSVLTHGPASPAAGAFDIDWAAGGGKLRLPVVGDDDHPTPGGPIAHLRVEAGQLHYHDNAYPLAPGSADDWGDPGVDADAVHARQHYELVRPELPPLLRRELARRGACRGARVVRQVALGHRSVVRRGLGRRAARRPSGRAARPGRLPRGPRRADRPRLRPGREDP